MPALAAAVPLMLIEEADVAYVAAAVGAEMEMIVAVLPPPPPPPPPPPSPDAAPPMTQVNACDAVNTPSNARTVTLYEPAVVPAPEMKPVLAISDSPGGSPVALYVNG